MKRSKRTSRQGSGTREGGSKYAAKMIRQENDPTLSAPGLRPSTRKRIAARAMSVAGIRT